MRTSLRPALAAPSLRALKTASEPRCLQHPFGSLGSRSFKQTNTCRLKPAMRNLAIQFNAVKKVLGPPPVRCHGFDTRALAFDAPHIASQYGNAMASAVLWLNDRLLHAVAIREWPIGAFKFSMRLPSICRLPERLKRFS